MSPADWRETWSLAVLEASAVSSRPRIWFWRYALAAIGFLALLSVVSAHLGPGLSDPRAARETGEWLARVMSVSAYAMAAVIAPLLAAGAVEDARRTGMLDLVIASPVPERRILLALAWGRLLATAQFFAPAMSLILIPVCMAGWRVLGGFLAAGSLAALAAALSSAFALRLASSGVSPASIVARLLGFIVFTPLASHVGALFCVPLVILLFLEGLDLWDHLIAFACLGAAFPFWGLGAAILAGFPEGLHLAAGAALAGLVTIRLAHDESVDRFRAWVDRLAPPPSREGRSYSEIGGWRQVLASFAGRREPPAAGDAPGESEENAPFSSLVRSRLLKISGIEKHVYLLTRRNPFIARRVFARVEEKSTVVACFGVLALYFLVAAVQLAHERAPRGAESGSSPGAPALVLGLLLGAYLAADEGARLLPSRHRAELWQSLLSSPLSGLDAAIGGGASVLLRVYPLLVALLLVGFLPVGRGFDPAGSAALLALAGGVMVLACGTSLWVSLILERHAERVAATLVLLLVLAALIEMGLSSGARSPAEILAAACAAAAIGLALMGSFAVLFRRVVRA